MSMTYCPNCGVPWNKHATACAPPTATPAPPMQVGVVTTPSPIAVWHEPIPSMTRLDWFAAHESLNDFCGDVSVSDKMAEELAGRPRPAGGWSGSITEMLKFEAEWRARLRYIRADAMLKEREKHDTK